jgi:hypothetical protein
MTNYELLKELEDKMKVKYKQMFKGYSGKADGMIYYFDGKSGTALARRSFTFKDHPGQPAFRSAQSQIYTIQPSQFYINNLKDYLYAYNNLPGNETQPLRTWTNVYNKLMFAMQKALPETVDLANITREQIYAQNLPCKTVKAAVEAGLLPVVKNYEAMTNEI